MNRFELIWLSLKRQFKKNCIFLLVYSLLFTLVIGVFVIKESCSRSIDVMLNRVGALINITGDFSADNIYTSKDITNAQLLEDTETILNLCRELESDDSVKAVNYHEKIDLNLGNYTKHLPTLIEINGEPFFDPLFYPELIESLDSAKFADYLNNDSDISNWYFSRNRLLYGTPMLLGESSTQLFDEKLKLITTDSKVFPKGFGRYFTEEEINTGAYVCIVPNTCMIYDGNYIFDHGYTPGYRYYNGKTPSLGDTIIYTDLYMSKGEIVHVQSYSFEIVGFYKPVVSQLENPLAADPIYIPNKAIESIHEQQKQLMDKYGFDLMDDEWLTDNKLYDRSNIKEALSLLSKQRYISSPRIELNDPRDTKKISDFISSYCSEVAGLTLITSTREFDKISGPIGNMASLSNIVLIVVILLSVLIISLLIMLDMRNQKGEIGIFMALGYERKEVITSKIAANSIIAFVSFIIACFAGNAVAHKVSDYMIKNYSSELVNSEFLKMNTQEVINSFRINVDFIMVTKVMLILVAVIIVSWIIGYRMVAKLNPKEVLTNN